MGDQQEIDPTDDYSMYSGKYKDGNRQWMIGDG